MTESQRRQSPIRGLVNWQGLIVLWHSSCGGAGARISPSERLRRALSCHFVTEGPSRLSRRVLKKVVGLSYFKLPVICQHPALGSSETVVSCHWSAFKMRIGLAGFKLRAGRGVRQGIMHRPQLHPTADGLWLSSGLMPEAGTSR